jgi:hypothetical protein
MEMQMSKYISANSWMSAMHEENHNVSIVLCQALEKLMKDEKMTFPEAYHKLKTENKISFINGNYGLNISSE